MTIIIDHPSPNHSPRKTGVRVDTVLLHHTATSNDVSAFNWLNRPGSGVSAHYLVGISGQLWRLVPDDRKAWHAGKGRLPWETCPEYDFNHRSIGIEVVNPGDGVTPFTEAQYRSLEWLVPDVVRRQGDFACILADEKLVDGQRAVLALPTGASGRRPVYVLGHRDVAPGRKTDPADNFDWARIREALAGGGA